MRKELKALTERYERDRGRIALLFFDGKDPGGIANITNTGDSHLHGEAVARIETANGLALYYKPRDCRCTELCGELTELLFGKKMVPAQITADGYAFQKEVPVKIPETEEENNNYYTLLGKLTALFYALGSTDMHKGNILSSADGPVVLDTETLLFTKAKGISGAGEFSMYYGEVFPELRTSVGECMVLPRFFAFMQTSPLVFRENRLPKNHQQRFEEGFIEGYRIIRQKQADVFRLLERFAQIPFRYLLRSTQSYASRIWLYNNAENDDERNAILEKLKKGLSDEEIIRWTPALEWEKQGILENNIPYFCLYAGRRALYGNASDEPLIRDYLDDTPIEYAKTRIAGLSENDLAVQLAYIRASLKHIDGWETRGQYADAAKRSPVKPVPSKAEMSPENAGAEKTPLTCAEAAKEAEDTLLKLWDERIPLINGCCLWHAPMIKGRVGSWFGLCEGFSGIALFVNACARSALLGEEAAQIAAELSESCVNNMTAFCEYLLNTYPTPPEEREILRRFNGGFDFSNGLSGLLWALKECSPEDIKKTGSVLNGFRDWETWELPKAEEFPDTKKLPDADAFTVICREASKKESAAPGFLSDGTTDCLKGGRASAAASLLANTAPEAILSAGRILREISDHRIQNGCYRVFPEKRRSYFLPAFFSGSSGIAYIMLRYAEAVYLQGQTRPG